MEGLSNLLFNLYHAIYDVDFPEFQEYALNLVKSLLSFDSAIWGMGCVEGSQHPLINILYLHEQSIEINQNLGSISSNSPLLALCIKSPGKTVITEMSGNLVNDASLNDSEHFGITHIASTIVTNAPIGIFSFISFLRTDPNYPFSEEERLLKQNVIPHLIEACDRSRIRYMGIAALVRTERYISLAVSDLKGILCNIEPGFVDLLLIEWPDWKGPRLPLEIIKSFGKNHDLKYCGSAIVIQMQFVQGLLFLRARKRTPVDRLSPRESSVAKKFAKGLTYKQIAKDLGLAPSTVRTHVSATYDKLGVSNKIELADILRIVN